MMAPAGNVALPVVPDRVSDASVSVENTTAPTHRMAAHVPVCAVTVVTSFRADSSGQTAPSCHVLRAISATHLLVIVCEHRPSGQCEVGEASVDHAAGDEHHRFPRTGLRVAYHGQRREHCFLQAHHL